MSLEGYEALRLALSSARAEACGAIDAVHRAAVLPGLPPAIAAELLSTMAGLEGTVLRIVEQLNKPDPRHGPPGPAELPPRLAVPAVACENHRWGAERFCSECVKASKRKP